MCHASPVPAFEQETSFEFGVFWSTLSLGLSCWLLNTPHSGRAGGCVFSQLAARCAVPGWVPAVVFGALLNEL